MVSFETIGTSFYFVLTTKNKSYSYYTKNLLDFDKWKKALSKICLQKGFPNYYTPSKIIGKGAFAKVVIANKKSDKNDYAAKIFDKRLLINSKDHSIVNKIEI